MEVPQSHESSINVALAEVLQAHGQNWVVYPESIGHVLKDGGRPDIVVERPDGWPVIIEAEVGNHGRADIEAQSRLGKVITANLHPIHASISLVYPKSLRQYKDAELREKLSTGPLQFSLFIKVGREDLSVIRFPDRGWIHGNVLDLAVLLHRCSIPSWQIDELAQLLERDVAKLADIFMKERPIGSDVGAKIAKVFAQPDDAGGQTRRMAMLTMINAFIFHVALNEAELRIPSQSDRVILHPKEIMRSGDPIQPCVSEEWWLALEVNN